MFFRLIRIEDFTILLISISPDIFNQYQFQIWGVFCFKTPEVGSPQTNKNFSQTNERADKEKNIISIENRYYEEKKYETINKKK